MNVAPRSRSGAAGAALTTGLLRFLTPRRVWCYPFLTFVVLFCIAVYDIISGTGLLNGLSGVFGGVQRARCP